MFTNIFKKIMAHDSMVTLCVKHKEVSVNSHDKSVKLQPFINMKLEDKITLMAAGSLVLLILPSPIV